MKKTSRKKKENDDDKYKGNNEKNNAMAINNSITYDILVNRVSANINPPRIELQCISKLVPPGGTYSRKIYCITL